MHETDYAVVTDDDVRGSFVAPTPAVASRRPCCPGSGRLASEVLKNEDLNSYWPGVELLAAVSADVEDVVEPGEVATGLP